VSPASRSGVRFGAFEADFRTGELRKSGIRIKIQDQPMLVLAALVERPGELVTREELQQRLWPNVSFLDFEHGLNMAVKKLRAALNDSAETPRYIETLARKGYRFVAPVEGVDVSSAPQTPDVKSRRWDQRAAVAMCAVVLAALAGLGAWRLGVVAPPNISLLVSTGSPVTAIRLSPDGNQIVYGLAQDGVLLSDYQGDIPSRLWVKSAGTDPPRRLTDGSDAGLIETGTVEWVPDGSSVSFLGVRGAERAIYTAAPGGGRPRKLVEVPEPILGFTWAPDGKSMVISLGGTDGLYRLHRIDLATGRRLRLTEPRYVAPAIATRVGGDMFPRYSPDGSSLVFVRNVAHEREVMVMKAGGSEVARAAPGFDTVGPPVWTGGANEVLFCASAPEAASDKIYRVRIPGGRPESVSFSAAGIDIDQVTVSQNGSRVAYLIAINRMSIWRYRLSNSGAAAPELVMRSARHDAAPAYAPDGRRFAFASDRTGSVEIYVSALDHPNPVRLTWFGRGMAGWPRWSPDGRQIAFDARPGDRAQVFVIDADGGTPQALTSGKENAVTPEWSPDGQWLYYMRIADDGGLTDIWKVRRSGGTPIRVTMGGQWMAFPSADGKMLYYGKRPQQGIFAMPLEGGRETQITADAFPGRWAPTRTGFYFIAGPPRSVTAMLMFYSYSERTVRQVIQVQNPTVYAPPVSISPDGTEALVNQDDGVLSQIMQVQNFR
jgi:Tol biopolymer transport system component/DNA-binding winged helix-turn-helix (wHTH) protein